MTQPPDPSTELLPALSLIGSPNKRLAILELALEAETRGFAGLACPGVGGNLALCASLAHVTSRIPFWSSIQPIYLSHPMETASTAAHIGEVSGGRFRLGLGVSHLPMLDRIGLATGKPLSDMRDYVAALHKAERASGAMPPILLAALRDRMLDLAVDIADGALWANASLSHTPKQVARISGERRASFQLANMVPTVIDADLDAARAIHRRTLGGYIVLPNYRNYWRVAGYSEEMGSIEAALQSGDRDAATTAMSDRWIDDCTISGSASQVRDRLAAWYATGVTPIAVMSSTTGGQAKAIRELFDLYS
jgi:alkanesulfonate monooxygenase SsuD/methylene tetrahydromethanopterin reductase-like flavin-dependent oxidoreductase (luciferase family)